MAAWSLNSPNEQSFNARCKEKKNQRGLSGHNLTFNVVKLWLLCTNLIFYKKYLIFDTLQSNSIFLSRIFCDFEKEKWFINGLFRLWKIKFGLVWCSTKLNLLSFSLIWFSLLTGYFWTKYWFKIANKDNLRFGLPKSQKLEPFVQSGLRS